MKTIAMFPLLCTGLLFGQTPAGIAFDTNAFLKDISHSKHYKIKKVDNRRIEWRDEDLFGFEDGMYEWDKGIFENDSVKKYLTVTDIEYIKQQYEKDTATYWGKTELKSFRLIDSLTCQKIQKDNRRHSRHHYYSFSTPLYTVNRNFLILKEEFNCGFMCMSWCTTFYRKDPITHKWVLVTHIVYIEA